jgi:hypothetical protein
MLLRLFLTALGLMCLFGGMISALLMVYYMFAMHGSVKPDKRPLLPFLGPFQLVLPQLWDEIGNRARVRFMISALSFGFFFACTALLLKVVAPLVVP